jgi:hypothetical protein
LILKWICKLKLEKEDLMKKSVIIFAFLVCAMVLTAQAEGQGMMGGRMMGSGTGGSSQDARISAQEIPGAKIFNDNCKVCHQNGGNIINPGMPLRGSLKLASLDTFLSFIRDPRMPDGSKGSMPAFSEMQISDAQAKALYEYITSKQGLDLMSRGQQGWYCPYCGQYMGPDWRRGRGYGMMGGGYDMGPGMMGDYGMGPGMMGGYGPGMMGPGYYNRSEECQKFLDESAGLRKEIHDKRFEYMEAVRNPKTTSETDAKLRKEIDELRQEIYKKTPLGCRY